MKEIKASDLRIGNYVLYEHTIEGKLINIIDWIDLRWISKDHLEFNKFYKPIPLAEEWLERFGFEKQDNNWKRLSICNDWTYLYWERLAGVELSVNKRSCMLPHINYVNQLQNLYHTLTGEELTINN